MRAAGSGCTAPVACLAWTSRPVGLPSGGRVCQASGYPYNQGSAFVGRPAVRRFLLKARIAAAGAALTLVLVVAPSAAGASSSVLHHRQARQVSTIRRDLGTLRFFRRRARLERTTAGRRAVRFARAELGWTRRELAETRAALARRAWPPHLALWLCIHHGEGAWYAVGRGDAQGRYNGLQMTWGWGNGIVGDPNGYTPLQIMWAAERGYRSSRYSARWLEGQWGATMPPCWRYA